MSIAPSALSQRRRLLLYSPHDRDKILVASNDLRLYELSFRSQSQTVDGPAGLNYQSSQQRAHRSDDTHVSSRPKRGVTLVGVRSELPLWKCAAWYERPQPRHLLAVGQSNGNVTLTAFGAEADRASGVLCELRPKHARACNAVSWNTAAPTHLAAALEKARNDASLLVWDIASSLSADTSASGVDSTAPTPRPDPTSRSQSSLKPLAELCQYEAVQSVVWFPAEKSVLAAGVGMKYLRIFDLREESTSRSAAVATTKAVFGACIDPFNGNRLASFSTTEGIVKVWDVRRMSDPILSLTTDPKQIAHISWCPSRAGLLAALCKDSLAVDVWSIAELEGENMADVIGNAATAMTLMGGAANASSASLAMDAGSGVMQSVSGLGVSGGMSQSAASGLDVSGGVSSASGAVVQRSFRAAVTDSPIGSFCWHPTTAATLATITAMQGVVEEFTIHGRLLCVRVHVCA
eukprot:Opistho-2@15358